MARCSLARPSRGGQRSSASGCRAGASRGSLRTAPGVHVGGINLSVEEDIDFRPAISCLRGADGADCDAGVYHGVDGAAPRRGRNHRLQDGDAERLGPCFWHATRRRRIPLHDARLIRRGGRQVVVFLERGATRMIQEISALPCGSQPLCFTPSVSDAFWE